MEAGLAGLETAQGIPMKSGVHRTEGIGGGFVAGLLLPAAPVLEQTVAQTPEHPNDSHETGQAHAPLVAAVRASVKAVLQAAFDAPDRTAAFQPLGTVQLFGQEAAGAGAGLGSRQRLNLDLRQCDGVGGASDPCGSGNGRRMENLFRLV